MRGKKRRNRKSKWLSLGFIVWTLLFINLAFGLYFSPATAVKKVYLSGHYSDDEKLVADIFEKRSTTPWIKVNQREIESELASKSNIDRVEVVSNVFGRAEVKIYHRQHGLLVKGYDDLYIDKTGVLFKDYPGFEVPTVSIDRVMMNGTILNGFPGGELVQAIQLVQKTLPEQKFTAQLEGQSTLSLYLTDGPRVDFGSLKKIDLKVKTLETIIKKDEKNFYKSTYVNLIDPDHPVLGI